MVWTPGLKNLGRLKDLKAGKGILAKKSPHKLCVCCIPSAPALTLGRDVGWGRKRVVRPAVSTACGWHPPMAISHPWHTPGKGLCILLCPDGRAHDSALQELCWFAADPSSGKSGWSALVLCKRLGRDIIQPFLVCFPQKSWKIVWDWEVRMFCPWFLAEYFWQTNVKDWWKECENAG